MEESSGGWRSPSSTLHGVTQIAGMPSSFLLTEGDAAIRCERRRATSANYVGRIKWIKDNLKPSFQLFVRLVPLTNWKSSTAILRSAVKRNQKLLREVLQSSRGKNMRGCGKETRKSPSWENEWIHFRLITKQAKLSKTRKFFALCCLQGGWLTLNPQKFKRVLGTLIQASVWQIPMIRAGNKISLKFCIRSNQRKKFAKGRLLMKNSCHERESHLFINRAILAGKAHAIQDMSCVLSSRPQVLRSSPANIFENDSFFKGKFERQRDYRVSVVSGTRDTF